MLKGMKMPAKMAEEGMEFEMEMEPSEGGEMAEESPLAGFSDDEIMQEAKARGLI